MKKKSFVCKKNVRWSGQSIAKAHDCTTVLASILLYNFLAADVGAADVGAADVGAADVAWVLPI